MVFFGDCSGVGVCVDHGSGHSAPCRLRRDGTRRFWFGGFFHMLRRGRREGVWFSLGIAPVSVCVLTTGVVIRRRAASGETARGVLVFFGDCSGVGGGLFHTRGAWERHRDDTEGRGAVAVCFEGCCGSMCWPGDRPDTHAAAGAAARGVRGIGGLFHMLGSGHSAPSCRWIDCERIPRDSDGKASPPCGRGCVCSGGNCGSGNAKQSFAGRIPKRSLGTT